jgi:hypothetical protein
MVEGERRERQKSEENRKCPRRRGGDGRREVKEQCRGEERQEKKEERGTTRDPHTVIPKILIHMVIGGQTPFRLVPVCV